MAEHTPLIRARREGAATGLPIVFSHALGMDLSMWGAVVAALAPRHPILRYDHRGQGGSAWSGQPYDIEALVDDAAAMVAGWGRGPVLFVGLSMGGGVAQGLAIRHPQAVRGLMLANTAAVYPEAGREGLRQRAATVRAGGMAAILEATLERFLSADCRANQPAAVQQVSSILRRADQAGYAAACEAIVPTDWLGALGRVACPVHVLAGTLDVGAPPAVGRQIAEAIPGASCAELPTAHLSAVESPQAFVAQLQGLIDRIGSVV